MCRVGATLERFDGWVEMDYTPRGTILAIMAELGMFGQNTAANSV
jgi:hypothetical protein